jgi:hypothetical protein
VRHIALANPALERRIRFEHGIEVADEQQPFAAAAADVPRDQMAGTPDGAHVDPLRLEPELLEFGRDHGANGGDAGLVHRPAVLVHPALEHCGRTRLLRIDRLHHRLFGETKRGNGWAGRQERDS